MSEERGERRPRPRGGRRPRRKVCSFCVDKIEYIDYKDVNHLRRYINERGKILPRRMSGNCAKHQRQLVRPSSAPVPSRCCPSLWNKSMQIHPSGFPEGFF